MRTKWDPNEIVLHDDYAEMILYDVHNQEKARVIIDVEDADIVSSTKWYLRPDGYVATNNYRDSGYSYLHSVLLDKSDRRLYVDHRDRNRLNNRKNNLRIATPSQNGMNKSLRSNNTSGRVGVHWSASNEKWCAMICNEGRHVNLGYFENFDDAVKCREKAEHEIFGEFKPNL